MQGKGESHLLTLPHTRGHTGLHVIKPYMLGSWHTNKAAPTQQPASEQDGDASKARVRKQRVQN